MNFLLPDTQFFAVLDNRGSIDNERTRAETSHTDEKLLGSERGCEYWKRT